MTLSETKNALIQDELLKTGDYISYCSEIRDVLVYCSFNAELDYSRPVSSAI
jgi:hypothetical protein